MHKSKRPGSAECRRAYVDSSWACIAFTGEHERASTAPTVEVSHRHRAAAACSVDVLVVSVVHRVRAPMVPVHRQPRVWTCSVVVVEVVVGIREFVVGITEATGKATSSHDAPHSYLELAAAARSEVGREKGGIPELGAGSRGWRRWRRGMRERGWSMERERNRAENGRTAERVIGWG